MQGANCSIFGYNTSRKHKRIAIFGLQSGNDPQEKKKKNGEKILYKSSRHREIVGALKKQIEVTSLHICELHYTEENFIRNEIRTTRVPYFTNEIIRIRKKRKIINKHSET